MFLFKGRHANATSFLLDTRALIPSNNERQPARTKHGEGSQSQAGIPKSLCT